MTSLPKPIPLNGYGALSVSEESIYNVGKITIKCKYIFFTVVFDYKCRFLRQSCNVLKNTSMFTLEFFCTALRCLLFGQ